MKKQSFRNTIIIAFVSLGFVAAGAFACPSVHSDARGCKEGHRCITTSTTDGSEESSSRSDTKSDEISLRILTEYDGKVPNQGEISYLGVTIEVPRELEVTKRERPNASVGILIDVSGSMVGKRIQHARSAAIQSVNALKNGDTVSIVTFSDAATTLVAPTILTKESRPEITRKIETIRVNGVTAMHAGLRAAIAQVRKSSADLQRIFLLSDGRANEGPSSPRELGRLASAGFEHGINIAAIGVGLDYDEEVLSAIAVRSAGSFYHLHDPERIASILQQELDGLTSVVAVGCTLTYSIPKGLELIEMLTLGAREYGRQVIVPVKALAPGSSQTLLLKVRNKTKAREISLGSAELSYKEVSTNRHAKIRKRRSATAVPSSSLSRLKRDQDMMLLIANYKQLRADRRAAEAARRGDREAYRQHASVSARAAEEAYQAAPADKKMRYRRKATRAKRRVTRAGEADTRQLSKESQEEALRGMDF